MIQAELKSTPAEAEADAMEVLTAAQGGNLTISEFIRAMQSRGVTISAAQDSLRVLAGRGTVSFTPIGNVVLKQPAVSA